MSRTARVCIVALAAALSTALAACSDDPADVAGSYTIALTDRANGCNLSNWDEGNPRTGVMVDLTQHDAAVSADVKGLAGSALDVVFGAHVFTGTVSGDHLSLTIIGTHGASTGACAYTYDAALAADLTGDTLNGTLDYLARTNAAADCGALTGCSSRQDFSGLRPPQ